MDLRERQERLENACLREGAERFRKRVTQAVERERTSLVGPGRKLVVEGIDPMSKAIAAFLAEANAPGKRGRKPKLVRWALEVGPDTLAFIALSVALDGVAAKKPVTSVATGIATRILDECKFRRLKVAEPHLHDYRAEKAKRSARYAKGREKLLSAVTWAEEQGKLETVGLEMTDEDKLYVGIQLIDLLVASTGLFEVVTLVSRRKGGKITKERWLVATPETIVWMRDRLATMELMFPITMPMVETPLEWGPGVEGGYRYALKGRQHLLRRTTGDFRRSMAKLDLPQVYAAINAVQATPWKINLEILNVVRWMRNTNVALAGIPSQSLLEFPPKPEDIAVNLEAKKAWKREVTEINRANVNRGSAVVSFFKVFNIAEDLKDAPAIFFPHNMDFRGRLYPISSYLSPQGDDLSRGLLTFAEGRPLGRDGAAWLAIHGANCLDEFEGRKVGRLTLEERVALIEAQSDRILYTADDPFSDLWWADADKPLCFLAFCFEWKAYKASGQGEAFVSSLPVAQDGTCNGLQHLAAMFHDEVGARAVNVLPSSIPSDVYSDVAERSLDILEVMAAGGDELAALWVSSGLVTRKLCKRPTMTFSYGSKVYGFRKQILEELKSRPEHAEIELHFGYSEEPNRKGKLTLVPKLGTAAGVLAGVIWTALAEVVVAAPQAMAWFQKVASVIVKEGQAVEWTVPGTGLPVRQEYRNAEKRQIKTSLCGTVYKPAAYHETDELNLSKQRNAVAPNIVHSLDAAALMLTVNQAKAEGIDAFAMIHDSYGTVAGESTLLARVLRQAFYGLYTRHDVPAELAAEWAQTVDSEAAREMLAPPVRGQLDLSLVLVSDYFFS